jgi:hypothetical protein
MKRPAVSKRPIDMPMKTILPLATALAVAAFARPAVAQ